jgi:toxin ParE1/3/4
VRIRRTGRAEADLIAIWTYIAAHNDAAADRILDELDARTQMLASFPHMGRPRPDLGSGVRSLSEGNYLILYRIGRDLIEVLRDVHARRSPKQML